MSQDSYSVTDGSSTLYNEDDQYWWQIPYLREDQTLTLSIDARSEGESATASHTVYVPFEFSLDREGEGSSIAAFQAFNISGLSVEIARIAMDVATR